MSRLVFAFCAMLALFPFGVGASKVETAPQWVIDASSVYPDLQYVIGFGEGHSQKEADTKAVESLAAVFNRSISSQTQASMSYSQDRSGIDKQKSLQQDVQVSTEVKDLIGVEVKERWKSKDGTFYALAVLEKARGIAIYMEKATACINAIEAFLNVAEVERNTFLEYFRCSSAISKAKELSVYSAYLSVLDPMDVRDWKAYSQDALRLRASNVAKNIEVSINIEGEVATKLKPVFEKIFAKRGFTVAKSGNARYVVNINLEMGEPLEQSRGRVMVRYNFEAELVDSILNETLIPYNVAGREIMFDEKAAQTKVFKTLQKKIESEFEASFAKYIEGSSK